MALKDMVKNVASEAMQKSVEQFKGGDALQSMVNNYNAISNEQANEEFGCYLIAGEIINDAFKLLRDAMVFTNKRIIFIDRTGATGSRCIVKSINYFAITDIVLSTAGFRFDDSEMDITYITTPNLKNFNIQYTTIHLEFPRKFPIQELYVKLEAYAYENCLRFQQ